MSGLNKYEHVREKTKPHTFEIVKVISEHKKIRTTRADGGQATRPTAGKKRVMASVRIDGGYPVTRHLDISK